VFTPLASLLAFAKFPLGGFRQAHETDNLLLFFGSAFPGGIPLSNVIAANGHKRERPFRIHRNRGTHFLACPRF
jgi:hypothetical protein